MNKLQTFHDFLSNIQKMLTEKLEEQEKTLNRQIRMNKEINSSPITLGKNEIISELELNLEHTKGQLYETNYILENFWDIISKK